ncbi:MAG: hypothetical protein ACLSSX_09375, partial [Dysosmobacter sp.]
FPFACLWAALSNCFAHLSMNIITETFLFCNSFPPLKAADLLEDPADFVTLFSFTSSCIYAMLWMLCRPPCPGFPGPVPIGGSYEAPHP